MIVVGPAFFRTVGGITYPFLVYDTFSGGGDLASHAGEKGTPWTVGGVTYTLGGGFVCPAVDIASPVFATGSDTFDDGYVDIEFSFGTSLIDRVVPFPYFDLFNGSGNLLQHTADSNHIYEEDGLPIANFNLDGTGGLTTTIAQGADPWAGARPIPEIQLPSTFKVTAIVNIGSHTGNGYTVFRFDLNNDFSIGVEVSPTLIYFDTRVTANNIPYVSGVHTIRVERTLTEDSIYFDDVLMTQDGPVYKPNPLDPFAFYLARQNNGPGGTSAFTILSLALEAL